MTENYIDFESCLQVLHQDSLDLPPLAYAFCFEELQFHKRLRREEAAKASSVIHKNPPLLLFLALSMAVITAGLATTSPARANDLRSISIDEVAISIDEVATISNQVARKRRKRHIGTIVVSKPLVGKPAYFYIPPLGHRHGPKINERPKKLPKLYSKPIFQQVLKLEQNNRTQASLKDEIEEFAVNDLRGLQTTSHHFRQRHLLRKATEALRDQEKAHQSMTEHWDLLNEVGSALTAGQMHSISAARLHQADQDQKNSEKKAEESLKRYRRAHHDKLLICYQSLEQN